MSIVDRTFDIEFIAGQILDGAAWPQPEPEDRKIIEKGVSCILTNSFYAWISGLNEESNFEVHAAADRIKGRKTVKVTFVTHSDSDPGQEASEIAYLLHKDGNTWRIIDAMSEDERFDVSSFTKIYRDEYRKDGFDALVVTMGINLYRLF